MSFPRPGLGRTTLALAAVVVVVMAYPWRTTPDRWALGIAAAVLLILAAVWRGMYLTTAVRRALALVSRGRRSIGAHQLVDYATADARTTVVLRVLGGPGDLPLDLIARYLDRYGVRCESVRVTSRDSAAGRTTWIGLTMSAAANLAALQARSAVLPLRQTAEITLRRIGDELRELGWTLTMSDLAVPDLLGPEAKEGWRAVADGGMGYVAGYRFAGQFIPDVLAALWGRSYDELWTAIEIRPTGVFALCAIRTDSRPSTPPLPGLAPILGGQWQALVSLMPTSTNPLDPESVVTCDVSAIRWPATRVPVTT